MFTLKATVIVAAHKPYEFPTEDMYLPVHVGSSGKPSVPGAVRDDTGEEISSLNFTYCELTGLYWLWKNGETADVYGLAHYRRFFAGSASHSSGQRILGSADVPAALGTASVVLARRRFYGIETVRSHYANAHHVRDLDLTRRAIEQSCPDYLAAFDQVMARRSLSLYNMFLMRAGAFEEYCAWLFGILAQVFEEIDTSSYTDQDKRVMGFLGERLLNVWAVHNAGSLGLSHRRIVQTEGEPVLRKGLNLIKRKLRRRP